MILVPGPVNVPKTVATEASKVVNHRSEEFKEVVKKLEELMSGFFETDHVALLSGSGTLGVESMVYSAMDRGEKVVAFQYGEFGRRLVDSLKRRGCEVVEVTIPFGSRPKPAQVEQVLDKHRDADAVAVVHNETSSGVAIRDLDEVSKKVKGMGMKFLVDSVSGFAAHPLRMRSWKVDAVASCSQKALASVPGLAFVALSESPRPQGDVPNYLDLSNYLRFQEKGETPYTAAVGAFYASLRAAELLAKEGLEQRWKRHEVCAKLLRKKLESIGISPVGDEEDFSNTVVAAYTGGVNSSMLVKGLKARGIEVSKGIGENSEKLIRIGTMGVVDWRALTKLIRALSEILKVEGDLRSLEDCRLPSFLEEEVTWD
ncbi:hydrogenase expression protein HypE [Sulfodiicoccus acidiphilus]|uniref:Hydrogenase expression protein HypE n=1 Tax=Sulfodiicoccus acidiphilus TaxID=1670455 RepID=A0A348B3I2_9CREN|nr:alanine--glyoxylate aminotransferase family protein [Sulfodiicoccus acidiphilus]BBD72734.1 hydrogenase expression protein HypE [Sulfodiicoccus acidiphilus]GGT95207.1 hydrogenase expression protein HypE [Sulfodiicoccus acidiphilus]